jgi:hypothetical protein
MRLYKSKGFLNIAPGYVRYVETMKMRHLSGKLWVPGGVGGGGVKTPLNISVLGRRRLKLWILWILNTFK